MAYLDTTPVFLDSANFRSALAAAGAFHDASIESIKIYNGRLAIELDRPYFPAERRYAVGGISGAILNIVLTSTEIDLCALRAAAEEYRIFEMSFDEGESRLSILFEDGYFTNFAIDPRNSTFSWSR